MLGWLNRRRERKTRQEELRKERGKLAVAVIDLDRKRHNVEELMKRMLHELQEDGRA